MSQLLFHFPLSNTPEISGVFREKRVIFDAINKPTQDVEPKTSGDEKNLTLSQAVENTKTTLRSLKDAVNADKESKTEESEKNDDIDTNEEQEKLLAFTRAHKALDGLMGKISGDDNEKSLNEYQNYFSTGSIENMTQVEAVHKEIISLIQEDVKYKESITLTEKEKSYVEKKIEEWGEEKILEILEKEDENITPKEIKIALGFVLQKSRADLDSEISEETVKNLSLDDKFSGKGDKIKAFFEKAQAEAGEKSLYFDSVKGISFKSKKDVLIDINTPEGKEKITESNTLEERIQAINKNKKEYRDYVKKDIKKNNSLLGMIFNLFGIDVSDPTQSGSFINFIRAQVLNLKTPEEYKPLKDKDGNEKSRSYLLGNDPEIQQKYLKPLLSRISQQQPVPSTKYQSLRTMYSSEVGKKLEAKNITSPTRVMAGDLLSRYPGSRLKYVSGERMKLDISGLNTSEKRQAEIETETIFKHNGGGAMATMKNMVSGLGGELMDSLSNTDLGNINLGDKLSGFLDSSTEDSSSQSELISAEKMAQIRKNNLGFPHITGYDCSNDVITIDFDQTPSSKDKDAKKDKKSTIPESVLGKNPF